MPTNAKLKIGDHVRISNYKSMFTKSYAPIWSEEVFVISKDNSTVPWTDLLISTVKSLMECFMKRNCRKEMKQKGNQKKK